VLCAGVVRGVVAYEGDMLLQAVHDDVEITLLKDEIEDTPIEPSPRRKVPVRARPPALCVGAMPPPHSVLIDDCVVCVVSIRWRRGNRKASRC
jgi:hypothetical protein